MLSVKKQHIYIRLEPRNKFTGIDDNHLGHQTLWCTSDVPWKERLLQLFYLSTYPQTLQSAARQSRGTKKILSQCCFYCHHPKGSQWIMYGTKVVLTVLTNQHLLQWRQAWNCCEIYWKMKGSKPQGAKSLCEHWQARSCERSVCKFLSDELVPESWLSSSSRFLLKASENFAPREATAMKAENKANVQHSFKRQGECLLRKELHKLMKEVGQQDFTRKWQSFVPSVE